MEYGSTDDEAYGNLPAGESRHAPDTDGADMTDYGYGAEYYEDPGIVHTVEDNGFPLSVEYPVSAPDSQPSLYAAAFAELNEDVLTGQEMREAFARIAEPLLAAPPIEDQVLLPFVGDDKLSPIPFTQGELDAIAAGQEAHSQLLKTGIQKSGIAREYWLSSLSFPRSVNDLADRPKAVVGMLRGAYSAHRVTGIYTPGSGFAPRGMETEWLAVLSELPARLQSHTPSAKA